jgi:hypothetical protein
MKPNSEMTIEQFLKHASKLRLIHGWKVERLSNIIIVKSFSHGHVVESFGHCDPVTAVCIKVKKLTRGNLAEQMKQEGNEGLFEWSLSAKLLGLSVESLEEILAAVDLTQRENEVRRPLFEAMDIVAEMEQVTAIA